MVQDCLSDKSDLDPMVKKKKNSIIIIKKNFQVALNNLDAAADFTKKLGEDIMAESSRVFGENSAANEKLKNFLIDFEKISSDFRTLIDVRKIKKILILNIPGIYANCYF
jgi:hypothetical protein